MPWINIPDDVIVWFRDAFAEANRIVAENLLNVPNIREPTLDDAFVQALIPRSAPTLLASGAIVRMDIHNLGGLRRVTRWEVADIGIVVFVFQGGNVVARKIALLQAKRLFPRNKAVDDDDPVGFQYGFNALLRRDPSPVSMALVRKFNFDTKCVYGAVSAGSDQMEAIDNFVKRSGHSVDYLLYNPPSLPVSIVYPLTSRQTVNLHPPTGCRVVPLAAMHAVLATLAEGKSPSFGQIAEHTKDAGWRVEHWAADLLLKCKVGRQYDATQEDAILPIIERRSGPIGAAIAVSIELPST